MAGTIDVCAVAKPPHVERRVAKRASLSTFGLNHEPGPFDEIIKEPVAERRFLRLHSFVIVGASIADARTKWPVLERDRVPVLRVALKQALAAAKPALGEYASWFEAEHTAMDRVLEYAEQNGHWVVAVSSQACFERGGPPVCEAPPPKHARVSVPWNALTCSAMGIVALVQWRERRLALRRRA